MALSSDKILEIKKTYAQLSLDEEGEGGLVIKDDLDGSNEIDFRCCLVGRFLTDHPINLLAMKNTLASI